VFGEMGEWVSQPKRRRSEQLQDAKRSWCRLVVFRPGVFDADSRWEWYERRAAAGAMEKGVGGF